MTYQELIDEVGQETIFTNTNVDLATQNVITEWFFDYELCDSEDTTKWMRYFRRRCNENYPKYKEMVRVLTIKGNMDPFITEFMEKIHKSSDVRNNTIHINGSGSKETEYGHTIEDKRYKVTTPTLDDTETYNNIQDKHDRGSGIKSKTQYDNYQEYTHGGSSGNNSDTTSGNPYSTTGDVTNTDKTRAVAIAYPEANMGNIGSGVDAGTNDIGYASSENRGWNEQHLGSTRTDQHLDQLVESEYTDDNESTKEISGSHSVTETGIDTNTKTGSKTLSKRGNEIVDDKDKIMHTGKDTLKSQDNKQTIGKQDGLGKYEGIDQGRHESVADLLPRAISAIIDTDEVKFFVNSLRECFDCYGRI